MTERFEVALNREMVVSWKRGPLRPPEPSRYESLLLQWLWVCGSKPNHGSIAPALSTEDSLYTFAVMNYTDDLNRIRSKSEKNHMRIGVSRS